MRKVNWYYPFINWLYLFFVIFIADLAAIYLGEETFRYVTKPYLMPFLILYFIRKTYYIKTALKKFILLALIFSWLGDVLLMFQSKSENFFLAGLIAFLFAHIFYIVFFHIIRVRENIKSNWLLLLIVVIYYAALISFLSSYLGDMKLPVRIYGAIISFMFMLAMHMLFIKNKTAGRLMMAGAFLFVISDSVLAINKFYMAYEWAGILIMLTYGLAQLFIVHGAIKYIRSEKE